MGRFKTPKIQVNKMMGGTKNAVRKSYGYFSNTLTAAKRFSQMSRVHQKGRTDVWDLGGEIAMRLNIEWDHSFFLVITYDTNIHLDYISLVNMEFDRVPELISKMYPLAHHAVICYQNEYTELDFTSDVL